jgi:hypothetical protein
MLTVFFLPFVQRDMVVFSTCVVSTLHSHLTVLYNARIDSFEQRLVTVTGYRHPTRTQLELLS